eukprot:331974-Hanusia_phi.AAC.2
MRERVDEEVQVAHYPCRKRLQHPPNHRVHVPGLVDIRSSRGIVRWRICIFARGVDPAPAIIARGVYVKQEKQLHKLEQDQRQQVGVCRDRVHGKGFQVCGKTAVCPPTVHEDGVNERRMMLPLQTGRASDQAGQQHRQLSIVPLSLDDLDHLPIRRAVSFHLLPQRAHDVLLQLHRRRSQDCKREKGIYLRRVSARRLGQEDAECHCCLLPVRLLLCWLLRDRSDPSYPSWSRRCHKTL